MDVQRVVYLIYAVGFLVGNCNDCLQSREFYLEVSIHRASPVWFVHWLAIHRVSPVPIYAIWLYTGL